MISDADDNMILELAHVCKADFITTGKTNGFTIKKFKKNQNRTSKRIFGNI